jgi:septum formation topological specificity factor MinE
MEALRKDILETISRHVAIDIERVKIDFLQKNPTAVKIEAPVRRTRISVDEAKPVDAGKYQAVEGVDQKM